MRPSPLQWLLYVGALVVSLCGMGMLGADKAVASAADQVHLESSNPTSLQSGTVKIPFFYHDFNGALHRFSCELEVGFDGDKAPFGIPLDHESVRKELDRRLAVKIAENAGALQKYTAIDVTHDPPSQAERPEQIVWAYKLKRLWKERLPGELQKEATRLEGKIPVMAQDIYAAYLQERGFDFTSLGQDKVGHLDIAYKRVADSARPRLGNCFDLLVREAGGGDEEEILGLLLAAFQEIPVKFPFLEEDGLYTSGFWPPLKVLQSRLGDCDSKSAALCSLWQHPSPQIILFIVPITKEEKERLPDDLQTDLHVLLGIEALPGMNQAVITVGLRNYALCEVVTRDRLGLEKRHPNDVVFSTLPLPLPESGFCMTSDCFGVE